MISCENVRLYNVAGFTCKLHITEEAHFTGSKNRSF